jgi:hypothetical protein
MDEVDGKCLQEQPRYNSFLTEFSNPELSKTIKIFNIFDAD